MKLFSKKTKKALIIGLDGVPHSLLSTYIKNDVMPNLKKILSQGATLHRMNASIPDISSVSWTSFNTGVNPGEHGIYGFTDLKPRSYSLTFPNSTDVQTPTFWEILGKTGQKTSSLLKKYGHKTTDLCRSIILNVPHTYPALPMNGILISGFVAIDLRKATFPESIYPYLHSIHYVIDVEAEKAKLDKPSFMKTLFECFEIRKKAISHFFAEESWDLFFACITETDRLHHFFFDASMEKENPFYEPFIRFYVELDKFIKILYDGFFEMSQEKGFFMILSDHGFAPIKQEVYVNSFLKEMGFLALKKEGEFYERIGDQTKAFDLDPCRVYLHDRESYPRGRVRREEREEVLREIKEALRTLKAEDGDPIIDQIFQKEEIYVGPTTERAPDLICLPKNGYDLKGSLEKKDVFGRSHFTGMHTWHDAFCIVSSSIHAAEKPSIENMADHILKYFTQ
jgi:predicted AlkP superfamily phosphohydrolase/phosphomutase